MDTTQQLSFGNTHFFIGIDSHLKNWRVTVRLEGLDLKTFSMNPSPLELLHYLQKHYPDGIYHIVYEAGFCGFWALRVFREHYIDCIIANPADVPTANKEKVHKSDPIDSRKLARELENKSLHGIYVPDIEREELRMLMRLRYRIIQTQTCIKNRIKGLLYTQGIPIPLQCTGRARWSHHFMLWLQQLHLHRLPVISRCRISSSSSQKYVNTIRTCSNNSASKHNTRILLPSSTSFKGCQALPSLLPCISSPRLST